MSISKTSKAKSKKILDISNQDDRVDYQTRPIVQLPKQSAIGETMYICQLLRARDKQIGNEEVEKEARLKAHKVSGIVLKLCDFFSKVGKSEVDDLLKVIFDDNDVMQCIRQRISTQASGEIVVDLNEMNLSNSGFAKKKCDVKGSIFR